MVLSQINGLFALRFGTSLSVATLVGELGKAKQGRLLTAAAKALPGGGVDDSGQFVDDVKHMAAAQLGVRWGRLVVPWGMP